MIDFENGGTDREDMREKMIFADADELIRANGEAEARQAQELSDLSKLYAEKIGENTKKLEEFSARLDSLRDQVAELIRQSDDFSHKENVRVYRNIQAATEQLLNRQTEELKSASSAGAPAKSTRAGGVQKATLVLVFLIFVIEVLDKTGVLDMLLALVRG